MTKARNYPGADRSRFVGDKFDGRIFTDLDKLLLHSTETDKRAGCPGYSNGTVAPTLTVNPWPGYRKVWQHFDLNESARALMNPASTAVSENKDNVCQIEIIGYSDKGYGLARGCYLPNLDADSRQWLASVFAFIMREWSIPNVWASPFPWPLYPASYGNSPSRMTSAEYDRFTGVLGHLHASGNNHGDPSLPVVDLKARVGALLTPQEEDMPLTAAEKAELVDKTATEVWTRPVVDASGKRITAGQGFGIMLRNSQAGLELAKAQALAGRALTAEETKAIVDAALDEKIEDATGTVVVNAKQAVQP